MMQTMRKAFEMKGENGPFGLLKIAPSCRYNRKGSIQHNSDNLLFVFFSKYFKTFE